MSDSDEFIKKTNKDVKDWMESFYVDGANTGFDLHCLWAWQEQERRHRAIENDLISALEEVFIIGERLVSDVYGSEFVRSAKAAIVKARGNEQ